MKVDWIPRKIRRKGDAFVSIGKRAIRLNKTCAENFKGYSYAKIGICRKGPCGNRLIIMPSEDAHGHVLQKRENSSMVITSTAIVEMVRGDASKSMKQYHVEWDKEKGWLEVDISEGDHEAPKEETVKNFRHMMKGMNSTSSDVEVSTQRRKK